MHAHSIRNSARSCGQQAYSHHLSGTSSTRPLIPKARGKTREGVREIEGGFFDFDQIFLLVSVSVWFTSLVHELNDGLPVSWVETHSLTQVGPAEGQQLVLR
jgi:hypothetical protein